MTGPRFLVLLPPPRNDRSPIPWRRTHCQGMFCLDKRICVLRHFFRNTLFTEALKNLGKTCERLFLLVWQQEKCTNTKSTLKNVSTWTDATTKQ